MVGNYTTIDAREFSSTLAAVLILFLPPSNKTLFPPYISLVFFVPLSFRTAECSYESHLNLTILFPLYHLNFLPTVSVSSKQRRPDLDLCLFIPKSPFASDSDAKTTTLSPRSPFLIVSYLAVQFLFLFFTPLLPLNLVFFLISSISFVNGYWLFIFLTTVFLDGILSFSVVFFYLFTYIISFFSFLFFLSSEITVLALSV